MPVATRICFSLGGGGEGFEDLVVLGEAPFSVLREDDLPVREDVEHASCAVLQDGIDAEFLLDGGRETRSPRFVVSNHAVLDDDVHDPGTCPHARAKATASCAAPGYKGHTLSTHWTSPLGGWRRAFLERRATSERMGEDG